MTDEPTAEVPTGRVGTARARDGAAAAPQAPGTVRPARGPMGTAAGSTAPVTGSDGVPASERAAVTERLPVTAGPVPPAGSATSSTATGPASAQAPAPRRRWRWGVALLTVLLLAALGAAGYLYATTTAYAERLAWTEDQARAIGTDLVTTRSELEGATSELDAVRAQLATAQERITALADEKAQIGDDREAQAQLLDYQARVSEAAGTVASALDRCVRGQDQLIDYLADADSYDPDQLAAFGADVERLCASASEANAALQTELADR